MAPPPRFLNIEDRPADFLLLEHHLRQHGLDAECRRVDSYEKLDAALDGGHWDLVISDFSLPGAAFQQMLARLKERLRARPARRLPR
ncbi:MAG: response regulator [Rhodocyclaceae bacterium]|nr:response regulator [Rhodocyclaceae bacterium]